MEKRPAGHGPSRRVREKILRSGNPQHAQLLAGGEFLFENNAPRRFEEKDIFVREYQNLAARRCHSLIICRADAESAR